MANCGWSYPAGCDGPPDDEAFCDVCGVECGSCTCPECPDCGTTGRLECYAEHALKGNPLPTKATPIVEPDFDVPDDEPY